MAACERPSRSPAVRLRPHGGGHGGLRAAVGRHSGGRGAPGPLPGRDAAGGGVRHERPALRPGDPDHRRVRIVDRQRRGCPGLPCQGGGSNACGASFSWLCPEVFGCSLAVPASPFCAFGLRAETSTSPSAPPRVGLSLGLLALCSLPWPFARFLGGAPLLGLRPSVFPSRVPLRASRVPLRASRVPLRASQVPLRASRVALCFLTLRISRRHTPRPSAPPGGATRRVPWAKPSLGFPLQSKAHPARPALCMHLSLFFPPQGLPPRPRAHRAVARRAPAAARPGPLGGPHAAQGAGEG